MSVNSPPIRVLDAATPQKVTYCIEAWLRDEQVKLNCRLTPERIQPEELKADPIAIVCYGPSLVDTWQDIKQYKNIMTCSGSHKFLVDKGFKASDFNRWIDVNVDPRQHKIELMGTPQRGVEYLVASACHPLLVKHLLKHNADVRLWHVFDPNEEPLRMIPPGEWQITGGCSIGLRTLVLARFLGFTKFEVFGMDGNSRPDTGKHAGPHPNQPKQNYEVEFNGKKFLTTPGYLEAARQTWHELDQLPDVTANFHGEGLVQEMAKSYVRKPPNGANIAFCKPELISKEYIELNKKLHEDNLGYGVGDGKYADLVVDLARKLKTNSILNYGSGKSYLARALPFPIWEYDPAIPGKDDSPRPADIVICADMLEHVEPDKLMYVLLDLKRVIKKVGFFVIHCGPSIKFLADGRNTHLIQQDTKWWSKKLSKFFEIGSVRETVTIPAAKAWDKKDHIELEFIVGPLAKGKAKYENRRWHILERFIKEREWDKGVEVGVKAGKNLLYLLANCSGLHMTGVDLFEARPGLEKEGGESHINSDLPTQEKRIRDIVAAAYPTRATIIKGESTEVAKTIEDGSLDFVFIDADHRKEAVLADIKAWRPKVRAGGMLLGHDLQDKFPGVKEAVTEVFGESWKLFPDSVWAVQL